jgi:heme/copper-type cytochrome/quinol oxidase subunit 1
MQNNFQNGLSEIIWLLVSLSITFILSIILFDSQFIASNISILLYDTYFVFPSWQVLIPLFLFVTLIIYVAKELKNRFGRTLPNMILLTCAILLIASIALSTRSLQHTTDGWTSYPPLSALGPTKDDDALIHSIRTIITWFQILVALVTLIITYRWWTTTRQNKAKQNNS